MLILMDINLSKRIKLSTFVTSKLIIMKFISFMKAHLINNKKQKDLNKNYFYIFIFKNYHKFFFF
jgi:hypothetical protein